MSKIIKIIIRYKIPIIIGFFGLIFTITGAVFKEELHEPWYLVIVELGIAGIIVSLAETFLLERTKGEMGELVEESSKKIKTSIEEMFPIIKQVEVIGIDYIFDPRYKIIKQDEREPTKTITELNKYIINYLNNPKIDEKLLYISGISCRDFLAHRGPHNHIFWDIISKKIKLSTKLSIRVLIMDKDGVSARERAAVEYGVKPEDINLEKTIVYKDLTDSYTGATHLLEDIDKNPLPKFEIEIKLFDFLPEAYTIMTNEFLFIEQYHVGRPKDFKGYFCLGGLVPVIKYRSGADMYVYMARQFDLVWNSNRTQFFEVKPFKP